MDTARKTKNGYFNADDCSLSEFTNLTSQAFEKKDAPHATKIEKNIPVYDVSTLQEKLKDSISRRTIMAEWADILQRTAGVIVLKNAYTDTSVIDAATTVYEKTITQEKQENGGGSDHFAKAGNNARIWNSLQKLCEAEPEVFINYFSNPVIDTVCQAWLGPNYQVSAQVNLVHPGGQAQLAHRDYHLGFQTAEISATYPAHVHDLSPIMTLQGAVAHCDMPIESGTTKLLPFSQAYRAGYTAWRREDFRNYFEEKCVQLPLEKGDALFFNPALFHGAGENVTTDIHRFANLLQVSSAFGRCMESIDRVKMCELIYDNLSALWSQNQLTKSELNAIIASTAEGYSFPTNLDLDPPIGGLAPQSQQELLKEALVSKWSKETFLDKLHAQQSRQRA